MINQIESKIDALRKDVHALEGQSDLLKQQIEEDESKLVVIEKNRDIYKKAVEVLDLVQQTVRKVIKDGFQSVVTNALQTIFGSDFHFELEFGRRGSLQEAYFRIKNKDIINAHNPIGTLEGGGNDVVALALRTVILELYQRKDKSPFICDEPFKFVSPEFENASGLFIKTLEEKMGRQIIMVTHKKQLTEIASNVIDLEKINEIYVLKEQKLLIKKDNIKKGGE